MKLEDIRKMSEAANSVGQQQRSALAESRRMIELATASDKKLFRSDIQRVLDEADRHQRLMRMAFGPLHDLRILGSLDSTKLNFPELGRFAHLADEAIGRYRMPLPGEVAGLLGQKYESPLNKFLEAQRLQSIEFQQLLGGMRSPWLDSQNALQSVSGFVQLQSIGLALQKIPSFDDGLSAILRSSLGDWRNSIEFPFDTLIDPIGRTQFYSDRGLDQSLTDFPNEAFEESLELADLGTEDVPLAAHYSTHPAFLESAGDEESLERTRRAYDLLLRFETQMRRFIDQQMRARCGDFWIKHRVPGAMSDKWAQKREKAISSGQPDGPLIAYADFTDYVQIIVAKNNWDEVFEQIFRRKEDVNESFQRLFPIRICAMHARLVTQDDELYLFVETKRLWQVMRTAR